MIGCQFIFLQLYCFHMHIRLYTLVDVSGGACICYLLVYLVIMVRNFHLVPNIVRKFLCNLLLRNLELDINERGGSALQCTIIKPEF